MGRKTNVPSPRDAPRYRTLHITGTSVRFSTSTSKRTQNICITFVPRRPNAFDVGSSLHKCYTNVLCLLMGWLDLCRHGCGILWKITWLVNVIYLPCLIACTSNPYTPLAACLVAISGWGTALWSCTAACYLNSSCIMYKTNYFSILGPDSPRPTLLRFIGPNIYHFLSLKCRFDMVNSNIKVVRPILNWHAV